MKADFAHSSATGVGSVAFALPQPRRGFSLIRPARPDPAKGTPPSISWIHADRRQVSFWIQPLVCDCHAGEYALALCMYDSQGRSVDVLPRWVEDAFGLHEAERSHVANQSGQPVFVWSRLIVPMTVGER